jgi:hypothetical protein
MIFVEPETAYVARREQPNAAPTPPSPAPAPSVVDPFCSPSSCHKQTPFFTEPDDMFTFTEADKHIFRLLRDGPQRIMTVVNKVGRLLPSQNKRQRIAKKRQTLMRITTLIRRRQIQRIGRVFVGEIGINTSERQTAA